MKEVQGGGDPEDGPEDDNFFIQSNLQYSTSIVKIPIAIPKAKTPKAEKVSLRPRGFPLRTGQT